MTLLTLFEKPVAREFMICIWYPGDILRLAGRGTNQNIRMW